MEGYRPFALAIVLAVILCISPSLGSASRRKTLQPRESYVRISKENVDDFCIARPQDTVVYCASSETTPRSCRDVHVNFTRKLVVLQGPEGKCVGLIDGAFDGDVRFDRSKIMRRLPVLYDEMEYCRAYYENGKWIEYEETRRDDVFTIPRNPEPVSSSYKRNRAPWVSVNLFTKPNYLCVGRNGSQEVFCSRNPREPVRCFGSSFVNFDYRHVTQDRVFDTCTMGFTGYYDMLVDVKARSELDGLPRYDRDPGTSCVSYGFIDGAQENPCSSDGRRCRP